MDDPAILRERAQNLWSSFARKNEPIDQSTRIAPTPDLDLGHIGGLEGPKEEIQTYACAATNPEVYGRWGTWPPSGLMLIGRHGVGKALLAEALASLTATSFIRVAVPRLVIEVIHRGGKVGELLQGWSHTLTEMPPLTVFFEELEFSQAREIGERRADLPAGPVMDFLLDLVDRTIAADDVLVVGSTSNPDGLRRAFIQPKRFERVVEVTPVFPDDVIAALEIHAAQAEKRAGHPLFEAIAWEKVVDQYNKPSTGDWVHILHAVLRRKARHEAASERPAPVTTIELLDEVHRFLKTTDSLAVPTGTYV